jgi:hypothetical protein
MIQVARCVISAIHPNISQATVGTATARLETFSQLQEKTEGIQKREI